MTGARNSDLWTPKIPFRMAVALGLVPGWRYIRKYGTNKDVGTPAETLRTPGGLYPDRASGTQFSISSDDAADVMTSGTGAWTVEASTLDESFIERSETLEMNGLTGVTLAAADDYRVYRAKVKAVGTGGVNAGIIYIGTGALTDGVPANIYAQIDIGKGQTQMALYTIPAGTVGLIDELTSSSSISKKMEVDLFARQVGESWRVQDTVSFLSDLVQQEMEVPEMHPAGTDIEMRGLATAGGGLITGTFGVFLKEL